MGRMELDTHLIEPRRLYLSEIAVVAGKLLNGIYLNEPLPKGLEAALVRASSVSVGYQPMAPIFRLMASENVRKFFNTGELQLGSLQHYRTIPDAVRRDSQEGKFLLVSRNSRATVFSNIHGGFDFRVLCVTTGIPEAYLLNKFDGAGFRIHDVYGFSRAVNSTLLASGYIFGQCVYSKAKVIVDRLADNYDLSRIDAAQILEAPLAAAAKLFVKPEHLCAEREFRILWRMKSDVESTEKIYCPEAIQYCSPLRI